MLNPGDLVYVREYSRIAEIDLGVVIQIHGTPENGDYITATVLYSKAGVKRVASWLPELVKAVDT